MNFFFHLKSKTNLETLRKCNSHLQYYKIDLSFSIKLQEINYNVCEKLHLELENAREFIIGENISQNRYSSSEKNQLTSMLESKFIKKFTFSITFSFEIFIALIFLISIDSFSHDSLTTLKILDDCARFIKILRSLILPCFFSVNTYKYQQFIISYLRKLTFWYILFNS